MIKCQRVVTLVSAAAFMGVSALLLGAPSVRAQVAVSDQAVQPSASESGGLEELVVTARKRSEAVQTVPISITAFSQSDLEDKNIDIRGQLSAGHGRYYNSWHAEFQPG
jgi:outer membrane receptor protein involved in Fe transport